MADPLADVIAEASREAWARCLSPSDTRAHIVATVRGHIAAGLDAEEERVMRTGRLRGQTFAKIRAALLGTGEANHGVG